MSYRYYLVLGKSLTFLTRPTIYYMFYYNIIVSIIVIIIKPLLPFIYIKLFDIDILSIAYI